MANRVFSTLGAIILALMGLVGQADAKLVAIVFDTSGSMQGRYQLPSFGMELLAGTLDGRAGFDRLWTLSFDEYRDKCGDFIPDPASIKSVPCEPNRFIQKTEITNTGQHQQAVDQVARDFIVRDPNGGTPYGPLEVMLNEIAENAPDGEEVVLVVVTDGAYQPSQTPGAGPFDGGRLIGQMKQSYAEYHKRMKARGVSISADFLLIDAQQDLEVKASEQGVRDTLLAEFSEEPAKHKARVTNASELLGALFNIIATVSSTDREAQKRFIKPSGTKIVVETPLSISRMIIVASGPAANALPRLISKSIDGTEWTDSRRIDAAMVGTDADFQDSVALKGQVTQLWFNNPVPAGIHALDFSSSVEGVFLLFETSAKTELQIFDSAGNQVKPNAKNEYEVFVGESYEFRGQILDKDATKPGSPPGVVSLATLPKLTMSITYDEQGKPVTNSMTIDTAANVSRYAWTPKVAGNLSARSRANAQIMSPQSEPLALVVLDAKANLTVSDVTSDAPCATCGPGEVASPVTSDTTGDIRVGRFDITATAGVPGAIDLNGTQLPDGYELRKQDGSVIDKSKPIPMDPGQKLTLEIWRPNAVTPEDLAAGTKDIGISVAPSGKWHGTAATRGAVVHLSPPGMSITLDSVDGTPPPGRADALEVPGGELLLGNFAAKYGLHDLVMAPDPVAVGDLVTVKANGLASYLLGFDVSIPDKVGAQGNGIDIRPKTGYLCLCFLGLGNILSGSDAHKVDIAYTQRVNGVVLQSAQTVLQLFLPIETTPMTISCGLNLLVALLFVMFLRGLIALVRTHRFPRGSVVEIQEGNALPSFKRLDTGNSVWWKAWFALFTGDPHEVRTVQGLRFKATSRGGVVDIARDTPPWTVERLGESYADLKENNPKKVQYPLLWGDRLQNTHQPALTLRFKKRSSDI